VNQSLLRRRFYEERLVVLAKAKLNESEEVSSKKVPADRTHAKADIQLEGS